MFGISGPFSFSKSLIVIFDFFNVKTYCCNNTMISKKVCLYIIGVLKLLKWHYFSSFTQHIIYHVNTPFCPILIKNCLISLLNVFIIPNITVVSFIPNITPPEYRWKIARWTLNTNQSINQSKYYKHLYLIGLFVILIVVVSMHWKLLPKKDI